MEPINLYKEIIMTIFSIVFWFMVGVAIGLIIFP